MIYCDRNWEVSILGSCTKWLFETILLQEHYFWWFLTVELVKFLVVAWRISTDLSISHDCLDLFACSVGAWTTKHMGLVLGDMCKRYQLYKYSIHDMMACFLVQKYSRYMFFILKHISTESAPLKSHDFLTSRVKLSLNVMWRQTRLVPCL
jgi:hypothetical protein